MAGEVRVRLLTQFGYKNGELPCTRTLRTKLKDLGFRLRKVRKCLPLKKIPQTDAIFDEIHQANRAADKDEGMLRVPLDTKATVKVDPFSRGGCNRLMDNTYWALASCNRPTSESSSLRVRISLGDETGVTSTQRVRRADYTPLNHNCRSSLHSRHHGETTLFP